MTKRRAGLVGLVAGAAIVAWVLSSTSRPALRTESPKRAEPQSASKTAKVAADASTRRRGILRFVQRETHGTRGTLDRSPTASSDDTLPGEIGVREQALMRVAGQLAGRPRALLNLLDESQDELVRMAVIDQLLGCPDDPVVLDALWQASHTWDGAARGAAVIALVALSAKRTLDPRATALFASEPDADIRLGCIAWAGRGNTRGGPDLLRSWIPLVRSTEEREELDRALAAGLSRLQ